MSQSAEQILQTLSNEQRLTLMRAMGYSMNRTIVIGCKPPQSGKTKEFIIQPTLENIRNDVLTIIMVPSRISLEKQTAERFISETKTLDEDTTFFTAEDEEQDNLSEITYIENEFSENIKHENIGRWDTGIPIKDRLRGPIDTIRKFESKDIRLIIALDNAQGMRKLCSLLAYVDKFKPDQKIHIISDESHGILDFKLTKNEKLTYKKDVKKLQKLIDTKFNSRKCVLPSEFHTRKVINTIWIMSVLRRNLGWNFSGTTATTAPLTINTILRELNFEIITVEGNIPSCYIGYSKIRKMYYDGEYKIAFGKILSIRQNFACVMFHSGRTNICHIEAGISWIKCCKLNGINDSDICFITDNQSGYTIYNSDMDIDKQFSKKTIDEPWKAVMYAQDLYTHVGIFGDIAMAESNTYQKCNTDFNYPITDIVVRKFSPSQSLNKMTSVIQKVGRIFTNDTINMDLQRNIWFYNDGEQNDRQHFENGLKIEACIQKESRTKTLTSLDFKNIKDRVINGLVDINGNEIDLPTSTDEQPQTLLLGVIHVLREFGPMTSRETYNKINQKGWFQNYKDLKAQIVHQLTYKKNSTNFKRISNNRYQLK